MSRAELIKSIEDKRGSRVICYITGDRQTFPPNQQIPGISTRIATEPQLIFYEHLKKIGHVAKLDLVLYTRGGDTNAVWPFVNLIREFCDQFSVLVPYRAHSAGTMIALGASEIVMTEVGELSPIDPTIIGPLNPRIQPQDPNSVIGISVEDVIAYIKLAKEGEPKLKNEESLTKVFEKLTEAVHPLALGNVNRVYSQIRQLAEHLLKLHPKEGRKDKEIIDSFVEKLYSHQHAISRKEAMEILGSDVVKKAEDESPHLWELFQDISKELCLGEQFNLKKEMGNENEKEITLKSALIESGDIKNTFQSKLKVSQQSIIPQGMQLQVPPGQQIPKIIPGLPININIDIVSIGWVKE
jgi:ClpP class serine protease